MKAGTIVTVNWRGALPKEANKARPGVVVDAAFFPDAYPNALIVPLATSAEFAPEPLTTPIPRTEANGLDADSFAISPSVTATSKARIIAEIGTVTPDELRAIREQIATCIGATAEA